MDIHDIGVVCTKSKLWNKKNLIITIITELLNNGYEFVEMVKGDPSYFVFADQKHEIEKVLKMKGQYYGIRIKVKKDDTILSFHSNTGGIDNVKYEIYTDTEENLAKTKRDVELVKSLIRPSSNTVVKTQEYLGRKKKITMIILIVFVAIALYFLNVFFYISWILSLLGGIAPFILFFLFWGFMSRRRY